MHRPAVVRPVGAKGLVAISTGCRPARPQSQARKEPERCAIWRCLASIESAPCSHRRNGTSISSQQVSGRAWSEVAPRFQFLIVPNRTIRCRFTFKFALRRNVRTICEICDPGHRLVAAEEPCYGNGRSTMTEQSSLQPASRGNGRRPDSLVRLGTAALVRLATAALALVVAMLVINPLASGRPLTSGCLTATTQVPRVMMAIWKAWQRRLTILDGARASRLSALEAEPFRWTWGVRCGGSFPPRV